MTAPRKILLIRPDRLGDLILSLPVAETLKKVFADCQVFYLAAPAPAEIRHLVDYVDGWIVDEDGKGRRLSMFELVRRIRRHHFDHLIELKPSWRTAIAGFLAGIPARIGTSRRFYSFLYSRRVNLHRRGSGRHQTELDLSLLKPLGVETSRALPTLRLPSRCYQKARELLKGDVAKYVVLHPGSGGSAPNWPHDHYRRLAELILGETDYKPVITGYDKITGGFDRCLNLTGRTDILALAGVLAGARLFISGSTGPLHLADALKVPCLSFFVSRPDIGPERWGPRRNLAHVLTPVDSCKCPSISRCRCLELIRPEDAFNSMVRVLTQTDRKAASRL